MLKIPKPVIALTMAAAIGLVSYAIYTNFVPKGDKAEASGNQEEATPVEEESDGMVTAYVAASNIPKGTMLTEEMIKAVEFPEDASPYHPSSNIFIGWYAQEDISTGTPLNPDNTSSQTPEENEKENKEKEISSRFSGQIPEGLRTATFNVDTISAVNGLVNVGDSVDVIATFSGESGTSSDYLVSNVTVGAIQNNATGTKQEISGTAVKDSEETNSSGSGEAVETVTVFATPDAVHVIEWLYRNNAVFTLTLRNPKDSSSTPTNIFNSAGLNAYTAQTQPLTEMQNSAETGADDASVMAGMTPEEVAAMEQKKADEAAKAEAEKARIEAEAKAKAEAEAAALKEKETEADVTEENTVEEN